MFGTTNTNTNFTLAPNNQDFIRQFHTNNQPVGSLFAPINNDNNRNRNQSNTRPPNNYNKGIKKERN